MIHSEHLAEKIAYILHHLCRDDAAGHKLHCSLGTTQLEIGIGDPILQTKYDDLGFLTTESLLVSLWRECSCHNITWHGTKKAEWVPKLQCINDHYIMDIAAKSCTKNQLSQINLCQIYTKSVTLSDIVTHNGLKIHDQYYNGVGNSGQRANFQWLAIE